MNPAPADGHCGKAMPCARGTTPVVHLELHTGNLPGACEFYAGLCGWRPHRVQSAAGSYLALELGERLGGGVVECGTRRPIWLPYVEVPDLRAATARGRELGGTVLLGAREGPAGWRSVLATPTGGEIALWQRKR